MYLRIQNSGVADLELFTMLGASTSRANTQKIGQFGSGRIMGALTCLRHSISPIFYAGTTRIVYQIGGEKKGHSPNGDSVIYTQVCYQISNRKPTPLGVSLEYGELDWDNLDMALREFVSNAIDNSYCGMDGVKIDLVENATPRIGHTCVYVEATPPVVAYFHNLKKAFLHFQPGIDPQKKGLITKTEPSPPNIHLLGVLTSTRMDSCPNSVYDYNCHILPIDESRRLSSSQCAEACAPLLAKDGAEQMINSLVSGEETWESQWADWAFEYWVIKYAADWCRAWKSVCGDALVCSTTQRIIAEHAIRHGFKVQIVKGGWFGVLAKCGIKTVVDGVGNLDKNGFEILPPTTVLQATLDRVVEWFQLAGFSFATPSVHIFRPLQEEAKNRLGDYNPANQSIGIREDHVGKGKEFLATMVHEMCHHVSGARDASCEFENAAIKLATQAFLVAGG